MTDKCNICGIEVTTGEVSPTLDCGGTCMKCMAESGDQGCAEAMIKIGGRPLAPVKQWDDDLILENGVYRVKFPRYCGDALHIGEREYARCGTPFRGSGPWQCAECRGRERDAIVEILSKRVVDMGAELEARTLSIPTGWKLVPEEPTKDMRDAFHVAQELVEEGYGLYSPDTQWAAMLSVAPVPAIGMTSKENGDGKP